MSQILEISGEPLIDTVMKRALQIPAAPYLVPRLLEVIEDTEQGSDTLERLILMDSGIGSAVLRLANSSYFGPRGGCETLHQAVLRLGCREIYQIAVTALSVRWMNQRVEGYGWIPGDCCRNALATATAVQLIAHHLNLGNGARAYTAGLLHEIGKLAIAHALPEQILGLCVRRQSAGGTWVENERALFGFDHTEISTMLMKKWNFPASLIAVARDYHNPVLSKGPFEELVLMTVVGKDLAGALFRNAAEDLDEPTISYCWERLGVGPEMRSELVSELKLRLERVLHGLR